MKHALTGILFYFALSAATVACWCPTGDCIKENTDILTTCEEVTSGPQGGCKWHSSLDPRLDERLLGGKVIAFKLKWFSGPWSPWYVPGYNDMDGKKNTNNLPTNCTPDIIMQPNSLRRKWSYFSDHTHTYIICK